MLHIGKLMMPYITFCFIVLLLHKLNFCEDFPPKLFLLRIILTIKRGKYISKVFWNYASKQKVTKCFNSPLAKSLFSYGKIIVHHGWWWIQSWILATLISGFTSSALLLSPPSTTWIRIPLTLLKIFSQFESQRNGWKSPANSNKIVDEFQL